MPDIIYVLVNEAMPGYVKIGKTTDLERRVRELDNTSVPLPFECFYACTVKDMKFVETQLHDAFMDHRVRSSREFFEIAPERAVAVLRLAELENVTPERDYVETPEDQTALNEARQRRRAKFRFATVGIPVGAVLQFTRDQSVTATVAEENNVVYNSEVMSLSLSAQKALSVNYGVAGTQFWTYEGETLDERRRRLMGGE
jgi:hypothetical protein